MIPSPSQLILVLFTSQLLATTLGQWTTIDLVLRSSKTERCFYITETHRLKMELVSKVDLGSCVQLYSLAKTPQLPPAPRIWAHIRGRYWSAQIDNMLG